ncbi:MAG: DUF1848 family protein [Selenomonas sp.]|nr:DUF1848 family protein [Selenomonas sp.]
MIISASRRTDIPAFYFDWFCQRLREGHVDVVNQFNRKQVSRISLLPEAVDCIVFWTKNPQADCWGMRKLPFMSKDMGELMDITRKKMSPTSIGNVI